MTPQVGEPAPDFTLPSTQGPLTLSRLAAERKVVLSFYYEDATPTCSSQMAADRIRFTCAEPPALRQIRYPSPAAASSTPSHSIHTGHPFRNTKLP